MNWSARNENVDINLSTININISTAVTLHTSPILLIPILTQERRQVYVAPRLRPRQSYHQFLHLATMKGVNEVIEWH